MAAAVPVAKLAYLAIKQVSKPVSRFIKQRAAESETVRTKLLAPLGQVSHWVTVRVARSMSGSRRKEVKRIKMDEAVILGAELVSETFIFSVAAAIVINEYAQSSAKADAKEAKLQDRLANLEKGLQDLHEENKQLKDMLHRVAEYQREHLKVEQQLLHGSPQQQQQQQRSSWWAAVFG
eukprot:m.23366 g.23366  ORF g.23366 m.23366 type:complete len:179 (+) comp7151_c0_seq1:226-762(+)